MNDVLIAKPYKDYLLRIKNMEEANKKYALDNMKSYNLFYDFASSASEKDARDVYEKEALIVDKIEQNVANLSSMRNDVFLILRECLLEKIKLLSRTHNGVNEENRVDTFLEDLEVVSKFRINHLDGINSQFALALEMGNHKSSGNLSYAILKTWVREQKIPLKNMQLDLEKWAMEKRETTELGSFFSLR